MYQILDARFYFSQDQLDHGHLQMILFFFFLQVTGVIANINQFILLKNNQQSKK